MKLSVLVTTYGRPAYLQRCLESLFCQTRPPDEIVVVTRIGDVDTETLVERLAASDHGHLTLRHGRVGEAGVLAANRAGMALVTGDIVCFIDDDASAHPAWLERIERYFESDPTIGAVGGRDISHTAEGIVEESTDTVGKISWYGRITGNHHKIFRGTCDTDSLKGVNMSIRRELITGFDRNILGNAHYYEMDLCFGVRRRGFRILFDGDLQVDHYQTAPRYLPGNVKKDDPRREYFLHHNRVYVMLKNLGPLRRVAFLSYTFIVEGAVHAVRLVTGKVSFETLRAIFRGKMAGLRDWLVVRGGREGADPTD